MHLFRRRASVRRSKKRPLAVSYRGFTLPALYRKKKKAAAQDDVVGDAPHDGGPPPLPPVRPERKKKKQQLQQCGTLWPLPTQVHPEYPSTMLKAYRDDYRRALMGLCRPASTAVFYAPTPTPAEKPPSASSTSSSSPSSPVLSPREQFLRASRARPRARRRWSTTESVLKFRGVPRPTLIRRARSGQAGRAAATSPTSFQGLGLGAGLGLGHLGALPSSDSCSQGCSCTCSCCSCCSRCPCEPTGGPDDEDDIKPLVWPVSRLMAERAAGRAADVDFPPVRQACRKDPALRQREPPANLAETTPATPTTATTATSTSAAATPKPAPRLSLAGLYCNAPGTEGQPGSPEPVFPPAPAQVVMRRQPGTTRDRPVPMKRYSLTDVNFTTPDPPRSPTRPQPLKRSSLHLPDDASPRPWSPDAPDAWLPPVDRPPTTTAPAPAFNRHSMIELDGRQADALLDEDAGDLRPETQRRPSTRVLPLLSINKYSTISRIRVPPSSPPSAALDDERRSHTMGRRRATPRRDPLPSSLDVDSWRRLPPVPPPASAKPRLCATSPSSSPPAALSPAPPLAATVLRVAQRGGPSVPPPVRPAAAVHAGPRVAAVEPQRRLTTAIGISMAPGQRATTRITEVQSWVQPATRLAAKPPPCPSPARSEGPALPPRPPKGLVRPTSPALKPPPANRGAKAAKGRSRSVERPPTCLDVGLPTIVFGGRARC